MSIKKYMCKFPILALMILLLFSAQAEESPITEKFENIFTQYNATKENSSDSRIKLLIKLDQDLRILINKPWTRENKSVDKKFWKAKYQAIGLNVGHYSASLEYSGQLLKEAKTLDVNSLNGSYTSYADICDGAGSFSGVCNSPNLLAAFKYEKDFRQGPFIEDTLIIIGNFYDDLFKALQIKDKKDFQYECFSQYMSDKPIVEQLEHARKSAIKYYTKALALDTDNRASNKSIREFKKAIKAGNSVGWHFCTD